MNKNVYILIAIFAIPLIAYYCLSQRSASNIGIATTTRPQVIKFTSNMCGECRRVEPVIKQVMTKYQDRVQYTSIPVQVNNKYNEEMISKYNVTLVPTIVILDKNQKVVRRIEGYVDEKTLDGYLKDLCK